jgi:hypothetical protein
MEVTRTSQKWTVLSQRHHIQRPTQAILREGQRYV